MLLLPSQSLRSMVCLLLLAAKGLEEGQKENGHFLIHVLRIHENQHCCVGVGEHIRFERVIEDEVYLHLARAAIEGTKRTSFLRH